jgi:hypothetical protein
MRVFAGTSSVVVELAGARDDILLNFTKIFALLKVSKKAILAMIRMMPGTIWVGAYFSTLLDKETFLNIHNLDKERPTFLNIHTLWKNLFGTMPLLFARPFSFCRSLPVELVEPRKQAQLVLKTTVAKHRRKIALFRC